MIVTDQCNQTLRYRIQVTVIYSHAILDTVTSECSVKRVTCKTWTGTLTKTVQTDQTLQKAVSDQGLNCLLKLQEVKGKGDIERKFVLFPSRKFWYKFDQNRPANKKRTGV